MFQRKEIESWQGNVGYKRRIAKVRRMETTMRDERNKAQKAIFAIRSVGRRRQVSERTTPKRMQVDFRPFFKILGSRTGQKRKGNTRFLAHPLAQPTGDHRHPGAHTLVVSVCVVVSLHFVVVCCSSTSKALLIT